VLGTNTLAYLASSLGTKKKVMNHWQQEKYAEDLLTYQEEIKQLKTSLQRKVK